jgi:hypothetical protein
LDADYFEVQEMMVVVLKVLVNVVVVVMVLKVTDYEIWVEVVEVEIVGVDEEVKVAYMTEGYFDFEKEILAIVVEIKSENVHLVI